MIVVPPGASFDDMVAFLNLADNRVPMMTCWAMPTGYLMRHFATDR